STASRSSCAATMARWRRRCSARMAGASRPSQGGVQAASGSRPRSDQVPGQGPVMSARQVPLRVVELDVGGHLERPLGVGDAMVAVAPHLPPRATVPPAPAIALRSKDAAIRNLSHGGAKNFRVTDRVFCSALQAELAVPASLWLPPGSCRDAQ